MLIMKHFKSHKNCIYNKALGVVGGPFRPRGSPTRTGWGTASPTPAWPPWQSGIGTILIISEKRHFVRKDRKFKTIKTSYY